MERKILGFQVFIKQIFATIYYIFKIFSLHEIGYYDVKAKIDYILATTKQEQLYYLAHSQGGTTFFILNSLRPEYNKRIKLMVAFAPAILIPNCGGWAFRALAVSNTLDVGLFLYGCVKIFSE